MSDFSLMVDILTIGAGALAIIGITVVGIQYLMAGRNEAKVKQSKKRMFELIIGLTVYAVMTVVLKWVEAIITGSNA